MSSHNAENRASRLISHLQSDNQSTNQSINRSNQNPADQSSFGWLSLPTDEIKARIHSNGLAEIVLNRPKSLNALTLPMLTCMLKLLTDWSTDSRVELVLVTGSGKAFCTGGDLKGLLVAGAQSVDCSKLSKEELDSTEPNRFLRTEYTLDLLTSQYNKPYVTICHGMTFGGGVGISIHGPYRIVGEDTRVAMPEVLIGLIPDVGGTHFLSRFPSETGTFCALTSYSLDTSDQIYTKSATHFVPRASHDTLCQTLRAFNFHKCASPKDSLNTIIAYHQEPHDLVHHPSFLQRHKNYIDDLFRGHSMASIKQRIDSVCHQDNEFGRFALDCRQRMEKASPTSLLLTLESLRRARRCSLAQCLLFEYRIVVRCVRAAASGGDFHEGVRAKILEKDNLPKWNRPMPVLHVHEMFMPLTPAEGPDLIFTEIQFKRSDVTTR